MLLSARFSPSFRLGYASHPKCPHALPLSPGTMSATMHPWSWSRARGDLALLSCKNFGSSGDRCELGEIVVNGALVVPPSGGIPPEGGTTSASGPPLCT